ncbi:hypothetical protein FJU08_16480 [Martelella alba]|uniref:Uncharacterized protein n=1 Tax=Martelella alba TaxID=2590451 RepID=A0A506U6D5_9HYPH|nr:hypothetical protein [Martelella alba]TPW28916.1 hypothetical protein FJU08_16480 [Martelella alba]
MGKRRLSISMTILGAGIDTQWKAYRHGIVRGGRKSLIKRKAVPPRLTDMKQRKAIVEYLVTALSGWRLSKFEYEAPCRTALRQAFCMQGHGWEASDREATLLVEEGLKRLGYARPSWEEGQRFFTQSPDRCGWCHGPIDPDERTVAQRFCCADCARMALAACDRRNRAHDGTSNIMQNAYKLIWRDMQEPRACIVCDKVFKPGHKDATCCSSACAAQRSIQLRKAAGFKFRPALMNCEECGTSFKPGKLQSRFCSASCAGTASNRKLVESLAHERRTCRHCGTTFTPVKTNSCFCSERCIKADYEVRKWEQEQVEKTEYLSDPKANERSITISGFDSLVPS